MILYEETKCSHPPAPPNTHLNAITCRVSIHIVISEHFYSLKFCFKKKSRKGEEQKGDLQHLNPREKDRVAAAKWMQLYESVLLQRPNSLMHCHFNLSQICFVEK